MRHGWLRVAANVRRRLEVAAVSHGGVPVMAGCGDADLIVTASSGVSAVRIMSADADDEAAFARLRARPEVGQVSAVSTAWPKVRTMSRCGAEWRLNFLSDADLFVVTVAGHELEIAVAEFFVGVPFDDASFF